ncbi:hypothetical protein HQ393_08105 [Chitinibacter bivalviorum]|uniref:Alpha-L-arabinofuranosidase n=1 Tax=Chitinibacter bivalviorum TaxID=2739434 RepID=A0A7H9BHW7_9NEIS|nr:hypothetical protein [Chitinibacter bivalviorum]QLG88215.1 hypothetical protein HQ393_08105 [Chitinibacter bivalviorum]
MMKNLFAIFSLVLLSACSQSEGNTFDITEGETRLVATPSFVDSKTDLKNLFGIHSLWWESQVSLADSSGNLTDDALSKLKYSSVQLIRYGGGVNEINWLDCTNNTKLRPLLSVTTWMQPAPCLFGPAEYANALGKLGAKTTWHIANVVGFNAEESPLEQLSVSAKNYASFVKDNSPNRVRYWEIGNELERGRLKWDAFKIALRSEPIVANILQADPAAKIVIPLVEYQPDWMSSDIEHNKYLVNRFKSYSADYALHMYYDNPPEGPSIVNRLNKLAQNIAMMKQAGIANPGVWITEHARWPAGNPSDTEWSRNWYQTSDISGVLSTADFLIGLSQINGVRGAMWHGLRAGPWNFIENNNQELQTSNIAELFRLLNPSDSMRSLVTLSTSSFDGDHLGQYAIRGAIFNVANNPRAYRVWLVNRSAKSKSVLLNMRMVMADGNVSLVQKQLRTVDASQNARVNLSINSSLAAIKNGNLTVTISPLSVSTFDITLK